MVISGAIAAVSAGLFYTLNSETFVEKWIGYQVCLFYQQLLI